jgi:Zinc-binding domain
MPERDWPAAPVPTAGKWVSRKQFQWEKSFGYFQCWQCSHVWTSAHAFKKYKQACKRCGGRNYVLPRFMWENQNSSEDDEPRRADPDKPHVWELCEACKRGVCKMRK